MDQGQIAMHASVAVKEIPPLRRSKPTAARKPLAAALLGLAMLVSASPLLAQTANTKTTYTYDALDRLTQVTDPSGLAIT